VANGAWGAATTVGYQLFWEVKVGPILCDLLAVKVCGSCLIDEKLPFFAALLADQGVTLEPMVPSMVNRRMVSILIDLILGLVFFILIIVEVELLFVRRKKKWAKGWSSRDWG
jgi:hypothetical protein